VASEPLTVTLAEHVARDTDVVTFRADDVALRAATASVSRSSLNTTYDLLRAVLSAVERSISYFDAAELADGMRITDDIDTTSTFDDVLDDAVEVTA
jgi:hypothetical protein